MTERAALLPQHARSDSASVRRAALVRKLRPLLVAGGGIALLAFTFIVSPQPHLVWNASASAPLGLYAVHPGALPTRGDMVIAWPPRQARALAAARHYLPANVPLVKRVVALSGDRVCAVGRSIEINGRHAATRLERDSIGRPLPSWQGCRTLAHGALFLLMDSPGSFDGRYFGLSKAIDLIGKATPLWLR